MVDNIIDLSVWGLFHIGASCRLLILIVLLLVLDLVILGEHRCRHCK